jgi:hypothetical protein
VAVPSKKGKLQTEQMNHATSESMLSIVHPILVEPRIAIAACHPSVLGMAVHAGRLGQVEWYRQGTLFMRRMAMDPVREWIAPGDPVTVMARPENE